MTKFEIYTVDRKSPCLDVGDFEQNLIVILAYVAFDFQKTKYLSREFQHESESGS